MNASNILVRSQLNLNHISSSRPWMMDMAEVDKALEAAPDDE